MTGASTSFGDDSTVVGGEKHGMDSANAQLHVDAKGQRPRNTTRGTGVGILVRTPDYFAEERPFLVRIGKDGLIGALQQLDSQLRTVRVLYQSLSSSLT
jgi:hypothetical protein